MSGLIAPNEIVAVRPEPIEVGDIPSIDADTNRKWFVLHTKSRREKRLAQRCREFTIRHYLPLRKSITGRRGRRHIADVPLFPGYLFCCMDRVERLRLFQTGHIAKVLDVVDQEGLLHDLQNIKNACEQGAFLKPCALVTKGQRVRIVDGPFAGLEGVVRKHLGGYRLVLAMECIRQAVACEVDVRMVALV
ncbi:MAG: hypothetical protein C4532_06240 [Candidatus Abyssobacteria bacterium SURF_17]|uniref:KOW domain-containing protein n=1 Tax=Candidatus Abyssobacteria bacterium SURF_17 TaxID=2093361 RepID=A0A419F1Z1_9BACT|nr:MAG: hypothetical protein C4532_06240 [Candidatus Abyssubacteria bacterium SURF_17]